MSMPTPDETLEHGLTLVDQESLQLASQADGFMMQARKNIDGLIDSVNADANMLVQQVMHSCDLGLLETRREIDGLFKKINQALDGQMLQVMGDVRPIIEQVADQAILGEQQVVVADQALLDTTQQVSSGLGLCAPWDQVDLSIGTGGGFLVNAAKKCGCKWVNDMVQYLTLQGMPEDQACATAKQHFTSQIAAGGAGITEKETAIGIINTCPCGSMQEPPPPTRWDCDTATGICTPSTTGQYATISDCQAACNLNPTCPPPTIACPPPVVNVQCPKPEKQEKDEVKFSVWQERDSKVCVITRDDEAPGGGSWQLLTSGQDLASASGITRTQCPPPKTRDVPDPKTDIANILRAGSPTDCANLQSVINGIAHGITSPLGFVFGLNDKDGGFTFWDVVNTIVFNGSPIGAKLTDLLQDVVKHIDQAAINTIGQAIGINTTAFAAMTGLAVPKLVSFLTGGSYTQYLRLADNAINFIIPSMVPSPDAAAEAYLRNSIDQFTLDCWTRMNGMDDKAWRKIVDSRRSKMSPFELTALWRRGVINTAAHDAEIRGLGFTDPAVAAQYRELSLQIPPPTDIIRMMVRDVVDEQTIDWTKEDDLFKLKYKDQLEEWGDQQGIRKLAMKYLWRAHFGIPSPSELFRFYHRLRNKLDLWPKRDPKKALRDALIQQDIAPRWVDFYIETSFRPINRVDTRRAFTIGAMTEDQLKQAYQNQGYNDANVKILVDFTKQLRRQTLSRSPSARSYRDGGFTRTEATQALQTGNIPQAEIEEALDIARNLRRARIRRDCTKSIEQRFLLGEIDEQQLRAELIGQGHDALDADDFVEGFKCKKASRAKSIPRATLCGWVEDGVISSTEMFDRLLNLGYSVDDATNLLKQCNLRVSRKKRAAAVKASKEAVRLAKQSEQSRRSRVKAQDRRLKELEAAAVYLAKGEGMLLDQALARVNAAFAALQFAFNATMDEALVAVRLAAQQTGFDVETLFEAEASLILQRRRFAATPPLQTRGEVAAEIATRRQLLCTNCFYQVQASESDLPLNTACPQCSQPMTIIEVIGELGGNGDARI